MNGLWRDYFIHSGNFSTISFDISPKKQQFQVYHRVLSRQVFGEISKELHEQSGAAPIPA
jgi:hypothetical protein